MKASRLLPWLFAILLLLGQQAGLLHQLGHELAEVAQLAQAADPRLGTGGQLPDGDGHAAGTCVLCIGFAGAANGVANGARHHPAVDSLSFARPLAAAPRAQPVVLAGTPIRGPPAPFSASV